MERSNEKTVSNRYRGTVCDVCCLWRIARKRNDIGDVGEDTFDDTDSQQPPKDSDDTDTKDSGDTPQEAEVTDDDPGQDDHEPPNPCVDPDGDGYGPECEAGPDCAPDDPLRFRLINLYVDADYDGHGTGDPQELCIGADVPLDGQPVEMIVMTITHWFTLKPQK